MDYGQVSGLQWQEKHLIKAIFVRIINLKEDEIREPMDRRGKKITQKMVYVFLS